MVLSVRSRGDQDDDEEECEDVEGGPDGVEVSDPARRHAADAAVDEHDERRKQEDLVGLGDVGGIGDGGGGENHGGH